MEKRAERMTSVAAYGRRAFVTLLCLSLIVWSVAPTSAHTPAVFKTIQDHLEMAVDHGHSHGFEEDLYWAMHGHSHDVADHDHNHAYLTKGSPTEPIVALSEILLGISAFGGPFRHFRIERPPRA